MQIHHPHTQEARLAQAKKITYKQAFQALYDRKNAFSMAHPFSARTLGQGNTFLYRQETICILEGHTVRVIDAYAHRDVIQLNLTTIVRPLLASTLASFGAFKPTLLNYSHGILAILATTETQPINSYILALNVEPNLDERKRVIRSFQPTSTAKLFVRHDSKYLYYGTHTGMGDDGHRKWEITGVSLYKDLPLPNRERALLLENFHGTDVGSTVAFEIYNDYFYAVSNQGTFEVEEIDYTSFYHWVSFPVDQPVPEAVAKNERLYRRQHKQGPIHDSWTDLTLQVDEGTNETVIVESRREWAQASSRQSRTFYVTKLELSSSDEEELPDDDPFTALLDSSNNAHWKPTPDLYSWGQHPEFCKDDPSPRSFILSRTKFRGYNYSCSSFLDLVEDDRCCSDASRPLCLRLRVGSRREYVPHSINKGKERIDPTAPNFVDKTQYRHLQIHMWPPPASRCSCSKRLHDILNPPLAAGLSHARTVTGVLDERRLVYMVKPGRSYGSSDDSTLGTVVLVDFSRPLIPKDNASAPRSAPLSLSDSACAMDDDFNASVWQWTPGLERLCRRGTCR